MKKSEAEKRARAVLRKFKVEEAPVPVEKIANEIGAMIVYHSSEADVSGVLYREGSSILIAINDRDLPSRQRFTLAHELGHLQLHEGKPVSVDRSLRVNSRLAGDKGRGPGEEREANWFAAELLMPEALVRTEAKSASEHAESDETLIQDLADTFHVSPSAMGYRLLNLGMINGI